MTNEIYFKLIAGSLGAATLLAFALLVGLTTGSADTAYQAGQHPVAAVSIKTQREPVTPIIRTSVND